jgi:hypothetical protein
VLDYIEGIGQPRHTISASCWSRGAWSKSPLRPSCVRRRQCRRRPSLAVRDRSAQPPPHQGCDGVSVSGIPYLGLCCQASRRCRQRAGLARLTHVAATRNPRGISQIIVQAFSRLQMPRHTASAKKQTSLIANLPDHAKIVRDIRASGPPFCRSIQPFSGDTPSNNLLTHRLSQRQRCSLSADTRGDGSRAAPILTCIAKASFIRERHNRFLQAGCGSQLDLLWEYRRELPKIEGGYHNDLLDRATAARPRPRAAMMQP